MTAARVVVRSGYLARDAQYGHVCREHGPPSDDPAYDECRTPSSHFSVIKTLKLDYRLYRPRRDGNVDDILNGRDGYARLQKPFYIFIFFSAK